MYSYHPQYVDAVAARMTEDEGHVYLQVATVKSIGHPVEWWLLRVADFYG